MKPRSNILKVSVIIPLYNQARFIERAISSALAQNETAEVVVVNDASTDDGVERVERIISEDQRVKLISQKGKTPKGAGAARNLGIKNSHQTFIAFLDADDYMLANRFKRTAEFFELNPNADAVCEALGYESNKRVTMMSKSVPPNRVFFEMEPFGNSGHFSVCGLTVKAHSARELGGFSEKLVIGEDTEWLTRLVLSNEVVVGNLSDPVAIRGIHDSNTTITSDRHPKDKPRMTALLLVWAKNSRQSWEVLKVLVDLHLKYHYEENRLNSTKSAWKKKREDLKQIFFLTRLNSDLLKVPKVKYFIRTVLGLPVKTHLDYYRSSDS